MSTSDPSAALAAVASGDDGRARSPATLVARSAGAAREHALPALTLPAPVARRRDRSAVADAPSRRRAGAERAVRRGGGASPQSTLPPIPGSLQRPPLARAPAPEGERPARRAGDCSREHARLLRADAARRDPSRRRRRRGRRRPYFLELAGSRAVPAGALPRAPPPAVPATAHAAIARPPRPDAPAPPTSATPRPRLVEFQPELVADARSTPRRLRSATPSSATSRSCSERVHGRPLVWLDNAATTQKPQRRHRPPLATSTSTRTRTSTAPRTRSRRARPTPTKAARDKVRRFLNAPSRARDRLRARRDRGDQPRRAELGPPQRRRRATRSSSPGSSTTPTSCPGSSSAPRRARASASRRSTIAGQVILEEYEKLLGPRTRLVSFTQVSNALGTITPAREMVAMAHRHGARVLRRRRAGGLAHAGRRAGARLRLLRASRATRSSRPTGIGVALRQARRARGHAALAGRRQHDRRRHLREDDATSRRPARFEAGTGNIADAVGLGAALDYVSALGIENIARYEHELLDLRDRRARARPGLAHDRHRRRRRRACCRSCSTAMRTEDVGAALDQEGIAVRSGHHCAQPILRRFGLESTVRASLAPYNTCEDIDALVRRAAAPASRAPSARPLNRSRAGEPVGPSGRGTGRLAY